jgi:hypothetical protein
MNQQHVYSGQGFRTLCGLSYGEGTVVHGVPPLPMCELCAVRDAAARLGGFKWMLCFTCQGTGSKARADSATTQCFRCMGQGLYPDTILDPTCNDCGHRGKVHDPNAGCLVGGCLCVMLST